MLPGTTECMIIFGVVVLLFGADKLPRLGGSVGLAINNFKKGIKSEGSGEKKELNKSPQEKSEKNS